MALYDSKLDWYDFFVPGSNLTSMRDSFKYVGDVFNDVTGVTGQQEFNSAEASKAYDREKSLRSTAYQDAVADLKAAGLNTALMYTSGAGPSATPNVNSASTNVSRISTIAPIVNSAANLIQASSNAGLNKAKIAQMATTAVKILGFQG